MTEPVVVGPCTLYLGDCLEVLPRLEPGCVDAVVTDPPYGVDLGATAGSGGKHGLSRSGYASYVDSYENFVAAIVPRLNGYLDAAERAAVFTGPHIHEQRKPSVIGGVYCSAGAGRHSWGFKTFLPVLFYGTAPDLHEGAKERTVIASNAAADPNSDHPCPKPLAWMRWLVRAASRDGETVCDPFMGSGTTGVACVKEGRRFIGVERDPGYFAEAVKRIRHAVSEDRSSLFPVFSSRSLLPLEVA